jgi:hypothetical protein
VQLRVDRGARPVHLVQRALGHAPGQVVNLGLMAQLQELEVHRQGGCLPARCASSALRAAAPCRSTRQRPPAASPTADDQPFPDQVQAAGVVADRAVCQPRRGPAKTNRSSTSVSNAATSSARRRPQVTHQAQAAPGLHPGWQAITVSKIISRRVKNRHGGSPTEKMALQALHQARSEERDASRQRSNSTTIAYGATDPKGRASAGFRSGKSTPLR